MKNTLILNRDGDLERKQMTREDLFSRIFAKLILCDINTPGPVRALFGTEEDKEEFDRIAKRKESLEKRMLIAMAYRREE